MRWLCCPHGIGVCRLLDAFQRCAQCPDVGWDAESCVAMAVNDELKRPEVDEVDEAEQRVVVELLSLVDDVGEDAFVPV